MKYKLLSMAEICDHGLFYHSFTIDKWLTSLLHDLKFVTILLMRRNLLLFLGIKFAGNWRIYGGLWVHDNLSFANTAFSQEVYNGIFSFRFPINLSLIYLRYILKNLSHLSFTYVKSSIWSVLDIFLVQSINFYPMPWSWLINNSSLSNSNWLGWVFENI